jgi:hypothetical protein
MKRKYKVSFVMTLDSEDPDSCFDLSDEEINNKKIVKECIKDWLWNEDWMKISNIKVKKVSK